MSERVNHYADGRSTWDRRRDLTYACVREKETAEEGNQRARVRKTRKEEGKADTREGEEEGIEKKTKKGRDELAKSGDEVSVVKSTVAAPAKNSN